MAFVHALTGFAGVNLRLGERRHDYGVDGSIYRVHVGGGRRVDDGYPVDFQMKSSIDWEIKEGSIVYDVESKAFNDLVLRNSDPGGVSLILILLCLPKKPADWVKATESDLVLRNCCYWEKVTGEPTSNKESKRIRIPRRNVFDHNSIVEILRREREGWPE